MKVIELGGGHSPMFHPNVDVREGTNIDIVADFNKPLPLESSEYDYVFSRYSIEHINWRNIKLFVSELYRITADGGSVCVITANFYEQCKQAIEWFEKKESTNTMDDWERVSQMVFGDMNYDENSHKVGWSPESIKKLFEGVGFGAVQVASLQGCKTDMIVEAWK